MCLQGAFYRKIIPIITELKLSAETNEYEAISSPYIIFRRELCRDGRGDTLLL
jgi:hypothetical protein